MKDPPEHRDNPSRQGKQREREGRVKESGKEEPLPYSARRLQKADLATFRPLLAYYLDVQKGKDMGAMDEREAKGRWKSFVRKWNAGELAMGWYDPETFGRVAQNADYNHMPAREQRENQSPQRHQAEKTRDEKEESEGSDGTGEDGEDIGPALPPTHRDGARHAAPLPTMQDLHLRDELVAEETSISSAAGVADIRHARRLDRKEQKDRLEELVPRADAGSHERRLEKKREVNDKMRSFREKSPAAAAEADEGELMGDESSLAEIKREKEARERKKSERELRREEFRRAKMAEREVRVREYREREQETVEMFRELVRRRGGTGL